MKQHRDPLPTMNDQIPTDRRTLMPIYDGIPNGTIRVAYEPGSARCYCETPKPRENRTGYRFNKLTQQTECFGYCAKCGLPIDRL